MKSNLIKILSAGIFIIMAAMPCNVNALESEVNTETKSVSITKAEIQEKIARNLEKVKAQIAGILNIEIGQIDKIIVKTTDKVNVILKDSNVNVDIDIKVLDIDININKK